MAKEAGSGYVNGTDWYYVDQSANEWRFTGNLVGTVANAELGSAWVEGDYFNYIDAFGQQRRLVGPSGGIVSGEAGSVWVETTFWAWVDQNFVKRLGHVDVPFVNSGGGSLHTDTLHSDVAAGGHGDTPAFGNHNDIPFSSSGGFSNHGDIPFNNFINQFTNHTDAVTFTDHGDTPHGDADSVHSDHINHLDTPFDPEGIPHRDFDNHTDTGTPHSDSIFVNFNDVTHGDAGTPHGDGPHGDQSHADTTSGTPHGDQVHGDSTLGVNHNDTAAQSHGDSPFVSHNDTAVHNDVPHDDRPVFIGP